MNYPLIAVIVISLLLVVYYMKKEGMNGTYEAVNVVTADGVAPMYLPNYQSIDSLAYSSSAISPYYGDDTLEQIRYLEETGRSVPMAAYSVYNTMPAEVAGGVAYGVRGASKAGMTQSDMAYYGGVSDNLMTSGQFREASALPHMGEMSPSLPAST